MRFNRSIGGEPEAVEGRFFSAEPDAHNLLGLYLKIDTGERLQGAFLRCSSLSRRGNQEYVVAVATIRATNLGKGLVNVFVEFKHVQVREDCADGRTLRDAPLVRVPFQVRSNETSEFRGLAHATSAV